MSRSRRYNPHCSITTAVSEKYEKQKANRRLRKKIKQVILNDDPDEMVIPIMDEIESVWHMSKDGKIRFEKMNILS